MHMDNLTCISVEQFIPIPGIEHSFAICGCSKDGPMSSVDINNPKTNVALIDKENNILYYDNKELKINNIRNVFNYFVVNVSGYERIENV